MNKKWYKKTEENMDNLYEYLTKEYNAHFSGWDFSYLKGRMIEDEPHWNYKGILEKHFPRKKTLLDMHTGGGEFLCSLSNLPKNVYATEGYEPNIPIAKDRLNEKGFHLKPLKNINEIPFENEYFDMIINRHGSFDIKEIKRTLQKDGVFISQKVGGLNGIDMNTALETKTMDYVEWCLIQNIISFKKEGMEVLDFNDYVGKMRFKDIGAFAFYLKWQPPKTPESP